MIKTTYRLGEVCNRLSSGKSIKASDISNSGDYPVYGGNGIRGFTNKYNFDGECSIIGRQGAYCGNVQLFKGKAYMTEHAVIVCGNEHANSFYLGYLLSTMDLGRLSHQAAQPGLSVKVLSEQEIELPTRECQDKLVEIISNYDNLITNNQKQIKLLEEVAQRLYKEWFVDLHFPGYEDVTIIDGVPEGWTLVNGAEIYDIKTGKKDANQAVSNGLYPFFTCSREDGLKSNDYVYDGKVIIVSGNGSYTGLVKKFNGKFDVYQRTYYLSGFKDYMWGFLYCNFKTDFEHRYMGGTKGSAIPYITKPDLEKYKILLPSNSVLKSFDQFVSDVFKEQELLLAQIELLKEARDRLVPKLMSGELEVLE